MLQQEHLEAANKLKFEIEALSSQVQTVKLKLVDFVCKASEFRLALPNAIAAYDPDPAGGHKMSDQRRLDTAFEEYNKRLDSQLRKVLQIGG